MGCVIPCWGKEMDRFADLLLFHYFNSGESPRHLPSTFRIAREKGKHDARWAVESDVCRHVKLHSLRVASL